jgi:hypothetical protein
LPLQAGSAAATLTTTWTRSDLSWPSAIPTLSSTDKVLYGIGRRYNILYIYTLHIYTTYML